MTDFLKILPKIKPDISKLKILSATQTMKSATLAKISHVWLLCHVANLKASADF